MPKITTKVSKKKLGVIENLLEVSRGLKKPLGAKLVIPTSGEDSTQNLSWVLFQEMGVAGGYTIEPRPGSGKEALSFPNSPGFTPREKGKRKLESVGGITNLDVSRPDDIFAGRAVVPSVIHPGFPALHFIRDTLAEKQHDIQAVKLEIGDEIVGLGRKSSKRFDPQKIGKVLVKHLKEIKESIAEKIAILLPQKRFDNMGKLEGQEPADVFRRMVKVVRAVKFSDNPEDI